MCKQHSSKAAFQTQALFLTVTDFLKRGGVTILSVPKRPVFHPELGKFFRGLRETNTAWGQRQAARIAAGKKFRVLNANSLGALERGAIKNPEPELLQEVAALYGVAYSEVAGQFLAHRYQIKISGRDLIDHASGVQHVTSKPTPVAADQGGAPHVVATARALADVTRAYQAFHRAIQDVSDRLNRVVQEHVPTADVPATGSDRPHRRGRR
jgi:hypothetical protein